MNVKLYKYENNNFILQAIIDDIQQTSFEHNYFSAGQFTITLNYNIPNAKLFKRGLFVQFGNSPYDFGEITSITNSIGENGKGSEYINIVGYDARYIFKRRIISNLNDNDSYNITADGETCIRSLITSQCGSGAETKRQLPVNMGTAGTLGEDYTVNESYSNLYDVLVTIATQSKIGWRLKFDGGSLTLEIYVGTDRHNSVFFSEDMDSIKTGTYQDSSNNYANAILVAGKGSGSDRDIYEGEEAISGSSPSGLSRYEAFDNQAELTTTEEYETEAGSMLRQYGQTVTVNGAGLIKSPYVFREQYDIGDYITIKFSDKSATVQITSITEQWSWNNYGLSFTFGKPINGLDRQLQLLMRKVQQASNANSENSYNSVKWYDVSSVTSQEESDVTFNTLGFTGSGGTFTLFYNSELVGSKTYHIYIKDLTNNLVVQTGVTGATSITLKAGSYITNIYVNEEGDVIKGADSVTSTSELINDSGFITSADVPTKTSELQNDSGFINSSSITTGSTVGSIAVDGTDVPINGVTTIQSAGNAGAICNTAKATVAKTVTINNFNLYDGVTVKVMFKNGNSGALPTLNVNGTGAHRIVANKGGSYYQVINHTGYWRGASSTSSEMWQANTIIELMYVSGTYSIEGGSPVSGLWVIVGNPVVESYYTTDKGYSVYADGLIEQWGNYSGRSGTGVLRTIVFPIQYANTYVPMLTITPYADSNQSHTLALTTPTNTQFEFGTSTHYNDGFFWKAIGY